jgi:hypothetical protein
VTEKQSRVRINLTGKTPKTTAPTPKAPAQSPTSRVRINLTGKRSN